MQNAYKNLLNLFQNIIDIVILKDRWYSETILYESPTFFSPHP